MSMKIKGINAAKTFLRTSSNTLRREGTHKAALSLFKDLQAATPVDTGEAKASWSIDFISDDEAILSNSADHIENLNNGSSKQAPELFIEKAALRYGDVRGLIVEKKG